MKFAGQVRFPEVDHPGIPVTLHVEDRQAELVLEGESLGRWSLFDVQATRLVSSVFEISLGREEITFIADNPMDFAYKGIEHMAEAWAGFKSRGFIRRFFSVRWSRRGTKASKLPELRQAMIDNLGSQAGRRPSRPRSTPMPSPSPKPAPAAPPRTTTHPEPSIAGDDIDAIRAERAALEAERARLEEERRLLENERAAAEREVAESIAAARAEIEKLEQERAAARGEAPGYEPAAPETVGSLEDLEAPKAPEPLLEEPEEGEDRPVEVEDEPGVTEEATDQVQAEEPPAEEAPAAETVLDLDELDTVPGGIPPVEPEPALAGASARSGLMGAVKAAFSKNSGREHVHEFVEAPAGIGIVRSICSECGYVSISTSD